MPTYTLTLPGGDRRTLSAQSVQDAARHHCGPGPCRSLRVRETNDPHTHTVTVIEWRGQCGRAALLLLVTHVPGGAPETVRQPYTVHIGQERRPPPPEPKPAAHFTPARPPANPMNAAFSVERLLNDPWPPAGETRPAPAQPPGSAAPAAVPALAPDVVPAVHDAELVRS